MATIKSIEEKAKAYDEAYKKVAVRFGSNVADEIFLKESEGEKVRKEIIDFIYDKTDTYELREKSNSWLAWLEKQGEQNPVNWFEELEEKLANATPEQIKEWKEKYFNENPADKVEPKFKVGDWIIHNKNTELANSLMLVVGKVSDGYLCKYRDGQCSYNIEFIDKEYRLWTIQDAKDGNVLYLQKDGKKHIIIYKGVIKERFKTFVSAYCAYNGIVDAFCFADVSKYVDIAYGGIMPATKEQHDLLFQKMKEAGYEWDADKKELKKIEQESTWNEKVKGLNEIETYILSLVPDRPLDAIKVDAKNIRYIINKKQNLAWSEEGKQYLKIEGYENLSDYEKIFDDIADKYVRNKNQKGYNQSWYVKERAAEMLYQANKELEKKCEHKSAWSGEDKIMLDEMYDFFLIHIKFLL